jgi:hypothetical protein
VNTLFVLNLGPLGMTRKWSCSRMERPHIDEMAMQLGTKAQTFDCCARAVEDGRHRSRDHFCETREIRR